MGLVLHLYVETRKYSCPVVTLLQRDRQHRQAEHPFDACDDVVKGAQSFCVVLVASRFQVQASSFVVPFMKTRSQQGPLLCWSHDLPIPEAQVHHAEAKTRTKPPYVLFIITTRDPS